MHRNGVWLGLVLFVVVLAILFGGRAAIQMRDYYSLTNQAVVDVKRWEIVGDRRDHYYLIAHFATPLGESSGAVGAVYRNPWAAERAKERFENEELKAWFNPKKPATMTLRKVFPKKSVLSAFVLIGLTIYFIGLGFYVGSRDQKG
ncbi:MAG: hypothetical protein H7A36_00275 [Chlamydiales bacterium]|nr:hypothetical protein [Chlamydiales bacterium]